eukprot:TRINITY_DN11620_c0_g2_i1.p1 TRINITY_DN11620_c0_g2~~TRINITY_DN11620_c0_g2_i1.p1  ORF type:complete len:692 (+),score=257.92 TRINITY_DN11620_c0_g2_i1:78-2153(+)
MGAMDAVVEMLQGEWMDDRGNAWVVDDLEVRVTLLGQGEVHKNTYKLQPQKKFVVLNGAKLESADSKNVAWKTQPMPGQGTAWTRREALPEEAQAGATAPAASAGGDEGSSDGMEDAVPAPRSGRLPEAEGGPVVRTANNVVAAPSGIMADFQEDQLNGLVTSPKGSAKSGGKKTSLGSSSRTSGTSRTAKRDPYLPKWKQSSYRRYYAEDSSDEEDDDGLAEYPLVKLSPASLRYTAMRLSAEERRGLRVLTAAIKASDYTDIVDSVALCGTEHESKRTKVMHKELLYMLMGMYVCHEESLSEESMQAIKAKDLDAAMLAAKTLFEIGRRYKMASPNAFEEYGKLLYAVQDCFVNFGGDGFGEVDRIKTVEDKVEEFGLGELLSDPRVALATTPVPRLPQIDKLNAALRRKTKVQKQLIKKYAPSRHEKEKVEQVIYSMDDRNVFIMQNATPCSEMIALCKRFFSPTIPENELISLTITEGECGSRLSHDHEKQYYFVLQSLTLWRNIITDMSYLWVVMEQDMLSKASDFRDTGQGVNRVQQTPHLYNAVVDILKKTKEEVGAWVGSERVHMGDNQVPNGLNFIDKYTQISKILKPILNTLTAVERIGAEDPAQREVFEAEWGSVTNLQIAILRDFFRFGFDGSGGDTDDDAGSCIDGRLTSAWNWCSLIRTKPFYPAFLLSGFSSFDAK